MDLHLSPFTKEDLIPQEETLEITKTKDDLFIGIPKENSFQEKRVCLPPPISPLNKITLYAALSIINFAAFLISSRL